MTTTDEDQIEQLLSSISSSSHIIKPELLKKAKHRLKSSTCTEKMVLSILNGTKQKNASSFSMQFIKNHPGIKIFGCILAFYISFLSIYKSYFDLNTNYETDVNIQFIILSSFISCFFVFWLSILTAKIYTSMISYYFLTYDGWCDIFTMLSLIGYQNIYLSPLSFLSISKAYSLWILSIQVTNDTTGGTFSATSSREFSKYMMNLIEASLHILIFLLIFAGICTSISTDFPSDAFNDELQWHDSFYFAVVSITTVGYGDIIPVNIYTRFMLIGFIILSWSFFPYYVTLLIQVFRALNKSSWSRKSNDIKLPHVVIMGDVSINNIIELAMSIYAKQSISSEKLYITILMNGIPNTTLKAALDIPYLSDRIQYVSGNVENEIDLYNAMVHKASGIILFSQPDVKNIGFDSAAMNLIAVEKFLSRLPGTSKLPNLYAQLQSQSDFAFSSSSQKSTTTKQQGLNIFYHNEFKNALIAHEMVYEGFLPLFINLIHSHTMVLKDDNNEIDNGNGENWLKKYNNCLSNHLIPIELDLSRYEHFKQELFLTVFKMLYGYSGDLLCAIEIHGKILLFPKNFKFPSTGNIVLYIITESNEAILCQSLTNIKNYSNNSNNNTITQTKQNRLTAINEKETAEEMKKKLRIMLGKNENEEEKKTTAMMENDNPMENLLEKIDQIQNFLKDSGESNQDISLKEEYLNIVKEIKGGLHNVLSDAFSLKRRSLSKHFVICICNPKPIFQGSLISFMLSLRANSLCPIVIVATKQDFFYDLMDKLIEIKRNKCSNLQLHDIFLVEGSPRSHDALITSQTHKAQRIVLFRGDVEAKNADSDIFVVLTAMEIKNLIGVSAPVICDIENSETITKIMGNTCDTNSSDFIEDFIASKNKWFKQLSQTQSEFLNNPMVASGSAITGKNLFDTFIIDSFFGKHNFKFWKELLSMNVLLEDFKNWDFSSQGFVNQIIVPKSFAGKTYESILYTLIDQDMLSVGLLSGKGNNATDSAYFLTNPMPYTVLCEGDKILVIHSSYIKKASNSGVDEKDEESEEEIEIETEEERKLRLEREAYEKKIKALYTSDFKIKLIDHVHTKRCDRRERICNAFGKYREFEVLQIESLLNTDINGIWLRSDKHADLHSEKFTPIEGTKGKLEYHMTKADIDCCIGFQIFGDDETKIQKHSSIAPIGPIEADTPKAIDPVIVGDFCPGGQIKIQYTYEGGCEGNTEVSWLQVLNGKRTQLSEPTSIASIPDPCTLTIDESQTGAIFKVKIRPVRSDGFEGQVTTSKPSKKIEPKAEIELSEVSVEEETK